MHIPFTPRSDVIIAQLVNLDADTSAHSLSISSQHHGGINTAMGAAVAANSLTTTMKPHLYYMSRDSWFAIASVATFFGICNLITRGNAHLRVKRILAKRIDGKVAERSGTNPSKLDGAWNRLRNLFSSTFFLTTLPKYMGTKTLGEAWWRIAYVIATMLFAFHETTWHDYKSWATQCGQLAYAQIPLIIGLAGKNNVISFVTGIGYEKLHFLHGCAAWTCLFLSWVHTFAHGYHLKGGFVHAVAGAAFLQWGLVAITVYTLIAVGAMRWLRKRFYEIFLISHIIMVILYLVACWMHFEKSKYWIYPGFIIWGFDRLVRVLRLVILNRLWLAPARRTAEGSSEAKVEVVGGDMMRLKIKRKGLKWSPGQHAFIIMPSVSQLPFEAHPFTLATIPNLNEESQGEAVFLIRARDGFTKRLREQAEGDTPITAYIDGPYGHACSRSHFDSVLFICGGSGISFGLSNLLAIVDAAKRGKSVVRKVKLIWMIRRQDYWQWVAPYINAAMIDKPPSLELYLDIYCTRGFNGAVSPSDSKEKTEESAVPVLDHDLPPAPSETSSQSDEKKVEGDVDGWLRWHTGRPDLPHRIADFVRDETGKISINVCGPEALQAETRSATRAVSSKLPKTAIPAISYHAETFGW